MSEPIEKLIEPVARFLLGEPNARLSSKTELRYGARGSLSVDLAKGTWFDHELGKGGGTLDLVTRETGLREAERVRWMDEHGFEFERDGQGNGTLPRKRSTIVGRFPYVDEIGTLLFEVVKFDPKDFRQRQPDPTRPDGWNWSVRGVRNVPYRLPELIEAVAQGHTVFVVEGEKDADRLRSIGLPATTNAGGAGKWRDNLNEWFHDADVVIIEDNDPQKRHPKTGELMFHPDGRPILPGQDHARAVAEALAPVAERVRLLKLAKSWPQMPPKGDVSNWLDAGHTREQLDALVEQLPRWSPDMPTADADDIKVVFPFPIQGQELPRRPWLVPGLLLRRQVTLVVAPPGSGKSLLTLQLAMLCTSGLTNWEGCGWAPRGRYRVLIINVEEDEDEMRRRLFAAAEIMQIDQSQLGGLCIAQTDSMVVAKADSRTKTVIATPLLERIVTTVQHLNIDIVVVDPFAETFAGDENSNSELKWAAVLWREVARRTNAAVLLVHHAKKYSQDMAGDMDAGRGGGALTGVARIVATLFTMTEEEASGFKIEPAERVRYIRFDDAKANLNLLNSSARWFEKLSFNLGNEGDGEPADEVGVLKPWPTPGLFDDVTVEVANTILDEIEIGVRGDDGEPTGDPYGERKSTRWAGAVIQQFLQCDERKAKKILDIWKKNGVIDVRQQKTSNSKGKLRDCVIVISTKRPGRATDHVAM